MKVHVVGQRPVQATGPASAEPTHQRGQNPVAADRTILTPEDSADVKSERSHPAHEISEPEVWDNFCVTLEQIREDHQQEVS